MPTCKLSTTVIEQPKIRRSGPNPNSEKFPSNHCSIDAIQEAGINVKELQVAAPKFDRKEESEDKRMHEFLNRLLALTLEDPRNFAILGLKMVKNKTFPEMLREKVLYGLTEPALRFRYDRMVKELSMLKALAPSRPRAPKKVRPVVEWSL